ncbi:G5 domain-containing protein [Anaerococcus sp. NML200537]|nr:G5 domain-containing protein [Anaerococcus sp. NML200537]MCW6701343.1 G5 domain-containing protein [Anaerococcus sp. NML200537]
MNKKQNLLAIAISASFILGGANVAQASDNPTATVVEEENIGSQVDKNVVENNPAATTPQKTEKDEEGKDAGKEEALSISTAQNNKETTADSTNRSANINENADPEPVSLQISEEKTPEAQKAFELKKPTPVGVYDPKNLTEEEIENVKKAVVKANPDVKASSITVSNDGAVKFTDPDGNEQTLTPAETVVKDYSIDEAKIKNFNENERYRSTQMEQGNGPTASFDNLDKENSFIDGYRYKTSEPSASSPDKKKWGYEIEIDKEKGQRTYTDFAFTNSGLMGGVLGTGNVPAKSPEDGALADGFKTPNYKASTEIIIDGSRQQRNLNANATEKDLEHINNINNKNTTMAWEGHYLKDNANGLKATQGDNAAFSFTVNPWPNENDKLNLIKLQGEYKDKVFVQGQKVNTGVKVQNLDENAKKRLVGQVYNPNTGKVVPGAKAYIDENGIVQVEMPQGVINKDGTLNKDSIFYKDNDYKGIQSLDVRFFARPRTEAEFRAVGKEANFGEDKYTSTGAGTKTINHNGEDVKVDLQGIDRYDHYNLIGNLKLNLDDTRYYDQGFKDGNEDDTSKHTSSEVKPGEEFEVNLYVPEDKKDKDAFPNQKTPDEMEAAKNDKQAIGSIDWQFINKINEGKKEKDKWKLEYDESTLPTKFKITPPKSAKAGDFVAVPLTYTYTNGSTDTHWFHFVVQDSTNNRPEYHVQIDYPAIEQKSTPKLPENPDNKKLEPVKYELKKGVEFKDDHGNEWDVSIDETTGVVTAKPKNQSNFSGGEKLEVPVVAHYQDKNDPEKVITEEDIIAEFSIKERFNKTPRYNAKAGKTGDELSSDIILDKNDTYNREPGKFSLASNTFVDDKGNTWNVSIDENSGKVTATVPNAEEGKTVDGALLNVPVTAHYYEKQGDKLVESGTKEVEAQFMAYGTNGKVEKTVEVPFETKVEKDPKLKKGEIKVITEGEKGSKKVTYTIEDSKIIKEEEQELKAPQERLIHVGEGVNDGTHKIEEKVEVGFETEIQFDDSLAPGETKEIQKGEAGEKKRDVNLTIEDGKVTKTETGEFTVTKAPKKRIIKVGRNTEGKVEHKEELPFKYKVEEVDTLKKGEYNIVKPGKVGTKTTTWTIKNSKVDGEPTVTEVAAEDALIQVGKGTVEGTHEVVEKKNIDYKTIIEYDENLDAGQQEVVKEGNPGEQERTNTLVIKDGQVTETKEGEFKTTKDATDRVVKVGTKPVTKVVEKPFNTEYVYDENLESGKTEEVTPGKNGKVTITTTYDKDQKKVVTSETEEKGQNRVVKIGGKTNGTEKVKEEIPFEVEVRKDPSLKKGEWKYAKDDEGNELKGEKGEQEKTLTIENSKVTNTSEPTVTKKAKNAVILIGEGTNDGTHEVVEKKSIDYKVKVEYDENLDAGQLEVVKEGNPGEQERTNTLVIKDGQVTETKEGEFKTTKEATDRVVKIGTKPITKVVEKPFNTEYVYDENLESGKTEEVTPGKNGKVTITTSYDKDQKKVVTSETEEAGQNRVVKIGGKTNGTEKIEEKVEVPFKTIVEFDDSLKPGEQKVTQEGEPGEKTRTTTLTIENGKVVKTENSDYTETKKPTDRIIKVGRNTDGKVEHKEEIPFGYKVEEVDDLKKGEYRIVKPGKAGTKTTTWTIKNSKIDGEPKVDIEPAEDALIQVGKGTKDGSHEIIEKKEIPFKTKIEYDKSLKPGEEKVVQEGEPGEKERTNTVIIKDGEVVETKEGEFKITKEPVDRIVRVGNKPSDGEITKTFEREIPFETEYIYDETLEAGNQIIEKEGKLGKEKVTITQKVEDSKPVGDPKETTEKITDKEDRVVRVGMKPVVRETELGHNTEYRHNPELKAGEEKVIEEGSKGSVKYTTFFNKKTGKLEVKEERTEPKNRVVEYGSKTDGEFKFESEKAYDVIIRENPNLDAGKHKVVQEGIPGKTETTVKVENSKEVSRDTNTIKEKQDMIIEIGTRNVCEIPPQPEGPKPDPKDPKPEEDPKNPQPEGPEDPKDPKPEGPKDPKDPKPEGPKNPKDPQPEGPKNPKDPQPEGPKNPKNPQPEGPKNPKDPKPNEPGTPGETPNRPNEPGEDPKTPQGPKENPKAEEKGEVSTPVADEKLAKKENKSTNPKTGIGSVAPIVTSMGISIAGLLATKKKKKED